MVTDPGGTIRYLSPSVERVLGYTPEEVVGTSTAEYVHPDDVERARGELETVRTDNAPRVRFSATLGGEPEALASRTRTVRPACSATCTATTPRSPPAASRT
jgi:PAS domain-containing protein